MMKRLGKELKFECADIYKGKIYFVDFDITFLFSLDLETGFVSAVSKIPDLPLFLQRAIGCMVISEGKMYLAPMKSECAWVYDIENDNWTKIELETKYIQGDLKYRATIDLEKRIYFSGYDARGVFCINKETFDVEYLNVHHKCGFGMVGLGDDIYIPCREKSVVLKVDTRNNSASELNIPCEHGFCDIIYYNGELYLAPEHRGKLLRWKDVKMQKKEYTDVERIGEEVAYISGLAACGNTLWMATRHTDGTIEVKGKEVTLHPGPSMYCFAKTISDGSVLFCSLDGKIEHIAENGSKKVFYPMLSEEQLRDACARLSVNPVANKEKMLVEENTWFSLKFFCDLTKENQW